MNKAQDLSLKHFTPTGGMELSVFLDTATCIAEKLTRLHHADQIHKRINPYHIHVNSLAGKDVKLTLISSSEHGIDEALLDNLDDPSVIQHLPYMSPEQTGRMNQVIDQRSDLYSLGILLFEMATGRVPFLAEDPMTLVHSHIAKAPPKLCELKPEWPLVISQIIERLLAKSTDERYKSCHGLYKDLAQCGSLVKGKTIPDFELGTYDYYETLHIPNKLYGRATELASIDKKFKLASEGKKQIVLLSGSGGTGKTALFDTFIQTNKQTSPIVVKGKFDQLTRGIAYSAIGNAFQELAKEFLTKSNADLAMWRDKLNSTWRNDGRLITELVPNLLHIVGEQPNIPERQPEEAKINFIRVFGEFVSAFASEQHPLVLFLDDLQWADSGSLELLEYLSELKQLKHLLLICAYRDDEIHSHHQAESFFKKLLSIEVAVSSFAMKPLSQEQIEEMIIDCLDSSRADVKGLAEFVLQKTKGNAFFVSRFLLSLYDDELLSFDAENERWAWNLDEIQARNVSSNVVELMTEKIQQFEPNTQKVMQLAAMLGNQFDTSLLSVIADDDKSTVLKAIRPAIHGGLFISLPDGFRFTHDRVQEAAYLSIPNELRAQMHLDIARLLLSQLGEKAQQEMLFDIARHYLHSLDLLEDKEEKLAVSNYLLKATEKAINSAAWDAALPYTSHAIDKLLSTDSWRTDFELTWQLFKYKAYCEYTTANLEDSEKTLKICLEHARTERQHVDMHMLYSRLLFQMNRHEEGIQNSKTGLAKLGINVPNKINKLNVLVEFAKFRWHLKNRSASDLVQIEELDDEHLLNICRILYDSVESSYMIEPETMAYFSLMMANICINHGHSIYAPFAYAMVSLVMTGVSKEYRLADDFAKMAIELNKVYPDKGVKGRVHMLVSVFSWHWTNPITDHAAMVNIASQCSQESGSMHWSYYSIVFSRPQSMLFNSDTVEHVITNNEKIYQFLKQHQDREAMLQQEHLLSFSYWLSGSTPPSDHVVHFDQIAYEEEMHSKGNGLMRAYFHCYESYRCFLLQDYQTALSQASEALQFVNDTFGNLINAPIHMFYILSYLRSKEGKNNLSTGNGSAKINKGTYLLALRALKKIARHNPSEFNAIYLLCEAERSRVKQKSNAITLFEEAISAADKSGYGFIKALTYELTAHYYLDNQAAPPARSYMEKAIDAYRQWGANVKVEQLHDAYGVTLSLSHPDCSSAGDALAKGGQSLDLEAIIQASQVLSREIEIDQVLDKLMSIVITIAGAESGHLVLALNDDLIVRASAAGDSEPAMKSDISGEADSGNDVSNHKVTSRNVFTPKSVPIDRFADIAEGVVHYVYRTGETILLGDALKQGSFKSEPYIIREDVKSLICLPMLRQRSVIGVLYLENRLVENAFTENHVSIINTILTQASISLENAELFEQRKQNLNELKRLSLAAEQSPNAIIITDTDGYIEYVNASYLRRSGLSEEEIIGKSMVDTQLQDLDAEGKESLFEYLETGKIWFKELISHSKTGEAYWEQVSISPVLNADRTIQNILLIKEDITSRKEQEAQILYQAQFDSLTDLPNRILATDRLNQAMISAHRNLKKCALLFIDLDDFKKINDTQGHEIGDLLLRTAAQRLKSCVRENDTVARQGGDEFIIILKDIERALDVEAVTEKIVREFQKPFGLQHMQMVVTTSVGIAVYPEDGSDTITLLRNADAAMYQAKERGRNVAQFFDQSINQKAVRRLELERHLRSALKNDEFLLQYQPVFDVENNQILGAEALIRWNSAELGSVFPDEFIPIAEQTGLIVDIGLWVLKQACTAGRMFRESFNDNFRMAVNVSPRQFRDPNFVSDFTNTLSQTGFPAQNLDIEVTEGLFLDTTHHTIAQLKAMKSLGTKISMDDFGTGYSSLNYLRRYPFDILKIDRSFIKDLNENKEDQSLVKAAIAMARSLGLKVVAEGVENAQHLDFIRTNGCEYAQGYYFSKPIIESEFKALLASQ